MLHNNKKRIKTVATLGEPDELSCSQYVAAKAKIGRRIISCSSFEMATDYVKKDKADFALVPGAYPEIRRIIMDPDLVAFNCFIFEIPSLVLAGKAGSPPKIIKVLFHHPATVRLLDELPLTFGSAVHVDSNAESCRRVLEEPDTSLAITNELCSEYFGLNTYKILRQGLKMPWVCFEKKKNIHSKEKL